MNTLLDSFYNVVGFLNGIVWSDWLVYLCLLAGIYFTVVTRFVQIRKFPEMIRMIFGKKESASNEGVSSYQSFMITVAARVGTANIVGVAVAIAYGGPGSVFWMWVLAILGAATSFAECTLAQVYKFELDGEYRGGTTYFIDKALHAKWLAMIFAVLTAIAFSVAGPGVHSNAMSSALELTFGIDPTITGIVLVVLMGFVSMGGVKRLASVAEKITPVMAIIYLLLTVILMVVNVTEIPRVIGMIVGSAFGQDAMFGGILGSALSYGIMRGIYSNEAGMGTATMAAAAAETSHPVKQGLVQALSVYIDTLVVCTCTAFIILVTDCYNVYDGSGGMLVENMPGVEEGIGFAIGAVNTIFHNFGGVLVTAVLVVFSFTTLMTTYYSGETNVAYIFKNPKARKIAIYVSRVLVLLMTFYGTQVAVSDVFSLADLGFGAMAWVNIISIVLLTGVVLKLLKDYESQKKEGLDPVFDPERLGIKDAGLWNKIKQKYQKED